MTRVGLGRLGLDGSTLLFTAIVTACAATMFGLVPAWRAARRDLTGTIKAGASGALAQGGRGFSGRNLLIVGETALALVLLTAGGLMLKSVARLQATELGFEPDSLLSARIALPAPHTTVSVRRSFSNVSSVRWRRVPRFESVAYGSCAPVQAGCNGTTIWFPDRPPAPGGKLPVGVVWASPTYFDTLGIRLVRGRAFTEHDRFGQPKVVVINETAARQLFSGEDPLGRRVALGQGGFGDGAESWGLSGTFATDRPICRSGRTCIYRCCSRCAPRG